MCWYSVVYLPIYISYMCVFVYGEMVIHQQSKLCNKMERKENIFFQFHNIIFDPNHLSQRTKEKQTQFSWENEFFRRYLYLFYVTEKMFEETNSSP